MDHFCFLTTPSGALCLLKGKDGLFYPTAQGPGSTKENWIRLIGSNTGLDAQTGFFKKIGRRTWAARYSVNMGSFRLRNGYVDDEWLDLEEISSLDIAKLSLPLKEALEDMNNYF